MGFLMLILGSLLGWLFGGVGVVTSAALALILGSWIVPFKFHRDYQIPIRILLPTESTYLCCFSVAGAILLTSAGAASYPESTWLPYMTVALIVFLTATLFLAWHHPRRLVLAHMMWRR
jgi:hypothetical protein